MRTTAPRRHSRMLTRGVGAVASLALVAVGVVAAAHAADAAPTPTPTPTECATAGPDLSSYDTALPGSATLPTDWSAGGSLDYGFTHDGLRVSNSNAGNVYLRAARVATPASETTPGCDGFTASFTIAAVDAAYQDGLNFSVALGGTSRYGGVLGFRHADGHLEVSTTWVPADATDAELPSWRSAVIATLDPATSHTVTATAYLVPGRANDVLQVSIDGTLLAQGVFTWEPYAGVDPSQTQPHDVDTLLFRAWTSAPSTDGIGYTSAPAHPELAGDGFVFSDIRYASFDGTAPTTTPLSPCTTPTATTVDERSGLLRTDLPSSPTRSLGGHAFTDDGLHVWTTGTTDAPTVPTSESKSAGYLDVDLALADSAPATADVTVTSGSAPGLNLILSDGRILVHEETFGADSWWSRTPTPGLPSGPHAGYQRAFGTLAEWAAALPSAHIDQFGYSLGSGAIGDATFRSLTLGCTVYSFEPVSPTPTPTTEPTATPTDEPTTPGTGTTPPPDPDHATHLGTTTEALLDTLRQLDVPVRTPGAAGLTISDAAGTVTGPLDAGTRYDVVVPWSGADSWVDVYLYSSRVYVGTFPLVDGAVRLTGLDLSGLDAGTHHLVLVGQQSGTVGAVQLEVTAASGSLADTGDGALAATGTDATALALVAVLLTVAGAALALVRHRTLASGTTAPRGRAGRRPRP